MKPFVWIPVAGLLLLAYMGAEARQAAGTAEGGNQPPPGQVAGDSLELVFEREVFTYPTFERRNPFRPLTGQEGGPRFEQLRLLGIVYSTDPRESIAVVAVMGGPGGNTVLQSYRIRNGETLGNSRVLDIREDVVVMSVEDFGIAETRVLEIRRPDWSEREAQPSPATDTVADTLQITPPSGDAGGEGDPDGDVREFGNGGSS